MRRDLQKLFWKAVDGFDQSISFFKTFLGFIFMASFHQFFGFL